MGRGSTLRKLYVGSLILIVLATGDCVAQSAPPDLSEASLEELGTIRVYTASKHLQSTADAPSSVTVIMADDIQKQGFRTLEDVLRTVRGFFTTNDRNYSSIGVRGFARPGDYNTRILLLIDGHSVNDNVYNEAMFGRECPIDIDLIERIEIIRGPFSSLYGSNALFAVVNIITRRGRNVEGIELSSSAGSFGTYEGRISYGRKLDQLEFLVSGTFYGSEGHKRLFFPHFSAPETNYGFAIRGDDDEVISSLATISMRGLTLQGVFATREKGIPTAPYGTVFNDRGTRSEDAHQYLDLGYSRTFRDSWDVQLRTFFDRYTYHGAYRYEYDPGVLVLNQDNTDGKWWGAEVQVAKSVFRRNRLTVGGKVQKNLAQVQKNYDVTPFTSYYMDRRSSYEGGLYLQDEISITQTLALTAGFRYDRYSYLDSSMDPRTALIYRPRSQTAFKFIYGQAFRAPNVYELYYSTSENIPNPQLRSERIRTTELVWEQGLSGHLKLATSGFFNVIDGLITEEPVGEDQLMFRNLQNARSTGLEVEVSGQAPHGVEAQASYSVQQTKDTDTDKLLSNSPRHLATLRLTQPLLKRKVFVSLNSQYRSRIYPLNASAVSPIWVMNATLLSRNIAGRLDLSASVYNLMGRKYFDPPSTENIEIPVQQDGRSFRLKMTWHLGAR